MKRTEKNVLFHKKMAILKENQLFEVLIINEFFNYRESYYCRYSYICNPEPVLSP